MNGNSAHPNEAETVTVLAIDPGTVKCGIAVLSGPPPSLLSRSIVPTSDVIASIGQHILSFAPIATIVLGDGTGSQSLTSAIRAAYVGLPLDIVDEFQTSMLARARFCIENPARGWRKLLPCGLRTPEQPYDDYVAVILAERWLQSQTKS